MLAALEPGDAQAGEIVAVGAARVVGGNIVSAKRRALAAARRHVIEQALAAARASSPGALAATGRAQLLADAARFIRSYRVLAESHAGGTFSIRISAEVDEARLRRQLRRRTAASRGATARAALLIIARGKAAPRFTGRVRRALRAAASEAGVDLRPLATGLAKDPARWSAAAKKARAGALLVVSFALGAPERVRGVGAPGVRATVEIALRSLSPGAAAASRHRVERWAVRRQRRAAESAALSRTLAAARQQLAVELRRRWPWPALQGVVVRLATVSRYAQIAQTCALLRRRGAACTLRRLARGKAALVVRNLTAGQVAALLSGHAFAGFKLRPAARAGRVLSYEVQPAASMARGSTSE